MTTPLIELQGIERVFHLGDSEVHALRGLDLRIGAGEYVAVMGPSGSGKSTLLNILGLLDQPNAGHLLLEGRDVTTLSPDEQAAVRSRRIGFVFQSFHLVPRLTAAENIALPMVLAGMPPRERAQRVEQALQAYGLTNRAHHKPNELSGGQRQRVAIGRAIVRAPKVFLFDEPLSNLDAALRGQTRVEIAKLHRDLGATTIYVTHDQVEAMTMADRIVVFNAGRIEQVGTPQALYEKPANVFVAGFIGSPRMNFIPAATARTAASLQAAVPAGAQQVGIRPEHFQVCEAGQGLALRVLGTEYLGAQRLLQGQLVDGTRVEWLIDGERSPQVGETLHITTRTDRLHAFDHNEQRLAQVKP